MSQYDSEDDDSSSFEDDGSPGNPDEQEQKHFLDVIFSFMQYKSEADRELGRIQEALESLSPEDLSLWGDKKKIKSWIGDISVRITANQQFLSMLYYGDDIGSLCQEGLVVPKTIPDGHRVQERNSSKVRSTLRMFVRDWAVEGEPERKACYQPLLSALLRHVRPSKNAPHPPAVCCPGSGLGRLPFDVARLGYNAQGNEFSYHMLLGSRLILNFAAKENCWRIFPYALCTTNRRGKDDHLRHVMVPDICPTLEMDKLKKPGRLSMCAGEFVEVYQDQIQQWDAILTAFFLDTAKNIFLYIRTFANILRPGGLWANLGPLLYHYAEMEHEISIELSWEEVKPAILKYFDIKEETRCNAYYTTNPTSLMKTLYNCVCFSAIRNTTPVEGVSNPVF